MRRFVIFNACAVLACPVGAFGQIQPVSNIAPPKLSYYEAAVPPPPPLSAARPAGNVILTLEIDNAGHVTAATVAQSLDPERDAAALAAASKLQFEPATRNDRPIAAKLRFVYEFAAELAPAAATSVSAPPTPDRAPAVPTPITAAGPATSPSSGKAPSAEPTQILVLGASKAERVRQSAQPVDVLELEKDQRKSGDLGELMARSRGVSVQRAGGLGSNARFGLNGLEGDQVRFFLDGVPLDFAGFSLGFANVPVNLVQRVEIYRGVVPTRFGADALGGVVDLITDDRMRSGSAFSYQAGAFDTHRVTAQATAVLPQGAFVRSNAFYDTTQNDYLVDVIVPDRFGREATVRVRRFHDAYRAHGLALEGGLSHPAKGGRMLSLRAHYAGSAKELQHGPTMVLPYGEVEQTTRAAGTYVRYRERLFQRLHINAIGGYAFGKTGFRDLSSCSYNWFGQCTLARSAPGELEPGGRDLVSSSHAVFVRATGEGSIGGGQRLRLSSAPESTWRTIDERRVGTFTGVAGNEGEQRLQTAVNGLEYQVDVLDERIQNVVFGKAYTQEARFTRRLPTGADERLERSTQEWGGGDAFRFSILPELRVKLSYEYATRLPRADEVFGDGALTEANLDLRPEVSHNLNLGVAGERKSQRVGSFRAEINGFFRDATDLIRRSGAALYFSHQNVARARTVGVEAGAHVALPNEYVSLDLAATVQDSRNRATSGPYAGQQGDRIPNRPYAFGSAALRVRLPGVVAEQDALALSWTARYVHEFFRTWESLGAREGKPTIPSQLVHTVSGVYEVQRETRNMAVSLELQNVTDERTYDFFGMQRPGRAAFFKMMLQI